MERSAFVALLTQLRQLDLRLLDRQLRSAQRLAREEAVLEQLLVPFELRLRGLELQRLHLDPSVEIDQRFLQRQPGLRLLVLLDLEILDDLVERQLRFADIELDDRGRRVEMGARTLEEAEDAGVERAREDALDFGGHRAGRHDRPIRPARP